MRTFPQNSTQACTRFIIMCMLADSDLDSSELNDHSLEEIYLILGITREEFLQIFRDYLHDLEKDEYNGHNRINLIEINHVNQILQEIDERKLQINMLALALSICKADHALNNAEIALFQHIMNHWNIDLTDLEIEVSLS